MPISKSKEQVTTNQSLTAQWQKVLDQYMQDNNIPAQDVVDLCDEDF